LNTYRRTLEEAAKAVGGIGALSVRLNVSVATIETWIRGEKPVPTRYFLIAVDILNETRATE